MSIKVITPGMLSTIQDGGRKGFAAMGFNASGVMDVRSYHIANALVGNFTDEAVIEMTYLGGSFKFLESNYIAITGADMSPKIDGVPVEMYTTVFVKQDETLTFSAAESGMRAYIAVRGGIDVPVIMGSRSTNLKCKLGGLDGRPLKGNSYSVRTFRDAMEAIEEGAADYAVLPIENSTAGAVNEVYDLLVEFENYIVGEVIIPITHTLAGLPGTQLSELKRVYSKAEALMQTTRFLEEHSDWQQISVANTAIAAKKILDDQDRTQAAVCSAYAAKVYGLEVLEDNINDESGNCTRFIIVTNQKVFLKGAKKISICFEVPHESGSLYHLLSHFIYNDLNMSKIESRPIEGRSWEYRFFVDFEGNLEEPGVKNALRGLREESRSLKILGNY